MKTARSTCTALLGLIAAIALRSAEADATSPRGIFENLPASLQARVDAADTPVQKHLGMVPFYFFTTWKKWTPGQTLRVGFFGGTPALHKQIADIAATWTKYANLKFDFGYDPQAGTYRQMGPGVSAEIRISFDQPGYWSLVGTDSVNPGIAKMNEASMNFSGFAGNPPPADEVRRVVLHEFGHGLGLQHEHQNPQGHCDAEFDWPKVRAYLKGPPNYWSDQQIDFNLRQMPPSTAYDTSSPDRLSIMFYHFEPWMFVHGAASPCCVPNNTVLSDFDKAGITRAYPADTTANDKRLHTELTRALADPKLESTALRQMINARLRSLEKSDK